ncbi:MAG: sigma-54 interaction domain-containing protein [bacterium]
MEKLYLLTEDVHLRGELASALPKGFGIAGKGQRISGEGNCIFFDLDTVGTAPIRTYGEKNFMIAVTGEQRTGPVMEAAASGAYEIVRRPFKAGTLSRLLLELVDLRKELGNPISITKDTIAPAATCAIVGQSTIIMSLCEKVARIAQVEVPVLITGETGTGKELIAEAIAQLSSRFGKPFVVVNCAAVPETLMETELFGYEKGAFTGALSAKEGMLKAAHEGTVFFDEIGELPLALQGKLLRFVQTQTFYPVGSTREVQVNVRVISATNRDLPAMIREGKFREDLYHRLRVATIHMPPLRERKKDIMPLVQCLLYRHAHSSQKNVKGITKAFLERLLSHDWPGNIRELENIIRSAIALCKTEYLTTYELKELGDRSAARIQSGIETLSSALIPLMKQVLERGEKNIYEKILSDMDKIVFDYVLAYTKENQSEAARLLGISRLTLRKKIGLSK